MQRDGVEVPRILEKCCEAIELHGLDSMGIYRLSGTTSRVQRLKGKLDRGEYSGTFVQESGADVTECDQISRAPTCCPKRT